jgi:hypothetical protein
MFLIIRTMRVKFIVLNLYCLLKINLFLVHQLIKPTSKGRQEELRFTFDVSMCVRIFYELHKLGNIEISHTMPPLDEIKRHAYCK